MADDLPTDPQEREIFLRALRDYSERCEHPKLTADCPFSIDISPDLRGCGEECMDLLARHGAPGPTEEFPLGDGLTAIRVRRPRPRRNAQKHPKAYDSREVYLHDQSTKPPSRWRLAAILRGIIEESCEPPPADNDQAAERKDRIYELIRCAELRGLNPDEHFLPHVRLAVAGSAFAQLLGSLHRRDEPESFDHTGGWAAVAEQFGTDDSDSGPYRSDGAWLGDLYGAIIKWSLACSLEELLDWMPPAPERFSRPLALPDPHSDDDGTWIVERFTRTFLWEWSVPSLRREWLYLHGQHPAPCSAEDMEVRAVSENELALLMADRLAAEPPPYSQLSARLVGSAASFITEGRRREAVALFEATLHLARQQNCAQQPRILPFARRAEGRSRRARTGSGFRARRCRSRQPQPCARTGFARPVHLSSRPRRVDARRMGSTKVGSPDLPVGHRFDPAGRRPRASDVSGFSRIRRDPLGSDQSPP